MILKKPICATKCAPHLLAGDQISVGFFKDRFYLGLMFESMTNIPDEHLACRCLTATRGQVELYACAYLFMKRIKSNHFYCHMCWYTGTAHVVHWVSLCLFSI